MKFETLQGAGYLVYAPLRSVLNMRHRRIASLAAVAKCLQVTTWLVARGNKLAKLTGISTKNFRYYDEIGLLSPIRVNSNGYRIYGQKETDRLQQILFYRELDVPLKNIKEIISSKDFDGTAALQSHPDALLARRNQLDLLIANVKKTIKAIKETDIEILLSFFLMLYN